jgi:hypothetical protein
MEELSLGKALALLQTYPDCCTQLPPAFQSWHGQLHPLRERRELLQADVGIVSKTFHAFPEHCCDEKLPHLAENSDFFLVYLLVALHAQESPGECPRLFQHLNGCYMCFDEYVPVLRDYYHMLQHLGGSAKHSQPS